MNTLNSYKYVLFLGLALILLGTSQVQAARISLMVDPAEVSLNEPFQLIYKVEGTQSGEPDFNSLNQDFQLLGTSSSSQISIINGATSQSKTYTLRVAPKRTGELVVPSIAFGSDQSAPGRIKVSDKVVGNPKVEAETQGLKDRLRLIVEVDVSQPYVQQQVLLTLKIYRRIDWQQAVLSELDPAGGGLLVKQLGKDKTGRIRQDGLQWEVIERKYAISPQKSGEIDISPFTLTVELPDSRQKKRRSRDPFDSFFFQQPTIQKVVRSNVIKLQVKPAVDGVVPWLVAKDLQLQENWSQDTHQLKAGESVARTIAIIADGVSLGQLPLLEPAEVAGIKRYPDQPQTNEQATSQGVLSTSSRKFALIPSRGGEFEIPPLEINWWNANTDKLETARLPGRRLQVTGVAAAPEVQATLKVDPPDQSSAQVSSEVIDKPLVAAPAISVPSVQPGSSITNTNINTNKWLLVSNGLLLLLWLITLYAWWRERNNSSHPPVMMNMDESGQAQVQARRSLLKELRVAVTKQDARASREVLLKLAKTSWPDNPPQSLTQMSQLTGDVLGEKLLAVELLKLERSLYAAGETPWDGTVILREMSQLKPQKRHTKTPPKELKPMYPVS